MAIAQFMAALDVQVVTTSLTDMQAELGATAEQIAWVQTIYIVGMAIMTPLSGRLMRQWGVEVAFARAVTVFLGASAACAFAPSLSTLLVARSVQGLAAGIIGPASLTFVFLAFEPRMRARANDVLAYIAALGPLAGPVLGGFITEYAGWRLIFLINLAPCAFTLWLARRRRILKDDTAGTRLAFDFSAFASLAICLSSCLILLERGPQLGWFEAPEARGLLLGALVSGAVTVWRCVRSEDPVIEFRLLGRGHFLAASFLAFQVGVLTLGTVYLLPRFMGDAMGYSPGQIGITTASAGIGVFVLSPVLGRLALRMDPLMAAGIGLLVTGAGLWTGRHMDPDWGYLDFAILQIVRVAGLSMVLITAQHLALSRLTADQVKMGASLHSLARLIGGAAGVAILSSMISIRQYAHQTAIADLIPGGAGDAAGMIDQSLRRLGGSMSDHTGATLLGQLTARLALTTAFEEAFLLLAMGAAGAGLGCLALSGLLALTRRQRAQGLGNAR
jgi:DHA2 family multidrug resistance protein